MADNHRGGALCRKTFRCGSVFERSFRECAEKSVAPEDLPGAQFDRRKSYFFWKIVNAAQKSKSFDLRKIQSSALYRRFLTWQVAEIAVTDGPIKCITMPWSGSKFESLNSEKIDTQFFNSLGSTNFNRLLVAFCHHLQSIKDGRYSDVFFPPVNLDWDYKLEYQRISGALESRSPRCKSEAREYAEEFFAGHNFAFQERDT